MHIYLFFSFLFYLNNTLESQNSFSDVVFPNYQIVLHQFGGKYTAWLPGWSHLERVLPFTPTLAPVRIDKNTLLGHRLE